MLFSSRERALPLRLVKAVVDVEHGVDRLVVHLVPVAELLRALAAPLAHLPLLDLGDEHGHHLAHVAVLELLEEAALAGPQEDL